MTYGNKNYKKMFQEGKAVQRRSEQLQNQYNHHRRKITHPNMEHISGSFAFDRFTDATILSLNQKETILN